MWSSLRKPESTTPNTEAAAGRGACGASSDARTSSAVAPTATRTMAITPTSPPPSETVAARRAIPLEQQQQQQCGHSSNKNRGPQRWVLRPEDDERFLQRLLTDDDNDDDDDHDQDDLETTNKNPSTSSSYREHLVLPQDTFHGICLFYKISPTDLRRANCFSGSSLLLAPRTLRIPILRRDASSANDDGHHNPSSRQPPPQQDTSTTAYKVQALRHRFPAVQAPEAQAFLESNDGDLQAAVDFLLQHCTVE
jgi:hypothetical protein